VFKDVDFVHNPARTHLIMFLGRSGWTEAASSAGSWLPRFCRKQSASDHPGRAEIRPLVQRRTEPFVASRVTTGDVSTALRRDKGRAVSTVNRASLRCIVFPLAL
jgi:hypothetical protein